MAKNFPKKLFVKIDGEGEEAFFLAGDDMIGMCDVGERVKIAVYQLVQTDTVEGLVKVIPPRKRT